MDFFLVLSYFTTLFGLVNAFLYIRSSARNNRAFVLFSIYITTVAIIQLATIFIAKALHKPNLFLSHFYFILQFVLLSFFYFELLRKKWILILLALVALFLAYQYSAQPDIFFKYNPIGMSITHTLIVLYAVLYFYKLLIGKGQFIIVNIGVFLYLLSSTLIFASGNLVFDFSKEMNYILINTNRILYLVFQILIFVEWWKNYSQVRIKS